MKSNISRAAYYLVIGAITITSIVVFKHGLCLLFAILLFCGGSADND